MKNTLTQYTPADLQGPGFELLDTLQHQDLFPFIKQAFTVRKGAYWFYNSLNALFALMLVGLMLKDVVRGEWQLSEEFAFFSYGLLGSFLLIPLHEYIHALAYRYVGATNTSYDMNLRKFYFMAMADRYVASAKNFTIVILAPFLVISFASLVLALLLPGLWTYFALGIFFTHTLFCSGDFGLLNYLQTHRDKELYTFDDKAAGESYFYAKR